MAVMKTIAHDILHAQDNEELFDLAGDAYPEGSPHHHNFHMMKRVWSVERAIPAKLVEEIARLTVVTEQKWREIDKDATSSAASDALLHFTDLVQKCIERADIKAEILNVSRYDAVLDEFEPHAKASDIETLFLPLVQNLPRLIEENKQDIELAALSLSEDKQKKICKELAQSVGFDFEGGRLDESAHPFSTGYKGDQRITVSYREHTPLDAIFALLHECGHALYEKQLPDEWQGLLIGNARGMALHESQSLFMENFIGKSDAYIAFLTQTIEKHDKNAQDITDKILQNCRIVKPNYIRIQSDELTYPAHILLRFDIEKQLFAQNITTKDIEEVWNENIKTYLHLPPSNKVKQTWMQDIHWFDGLFGYFPHYLVGNIAAAQLFEAFTATLDDTTEHYKNLKKGDTRLVQEWLEANIHRYGALHTTSTVTEKATKTPLSANSLLRYLTERFSHCKTMR